MKLLNQEQTLSLAAAKSGMDEKTARKYRRLRKLPSDFWEQQSWGLKLPRNGALSNCVYCFLKGVSNLEQVHKEMEHRKKTKVRGFGSTIDTPCDIGWWMRMEEKYGRDLVAENGVVARPGANR